jgi:hypothetical protein
VQKDGCPKHALGKKQNQGKASLHFGSCERPRIGGIGKFCPWVEKPSSLIFEHHTPPLRYGKTEAPWHPNIDSFVKNQEFMELRVAKTTCRESRNVVLVAFCENNNIHR